ncbi:MAG: hypothetical protein IT361_04365 [Gemmatimonadaceae bacterium]|nr:hypothetical protein [Gemmatimonadaceae bacterium]
MILRSHVTTRLHRVFDGAYAIAEARGQRDISSAHLLLALLREGGSLAAQYLLARGVPLQGLAAEMEQELGESSESPTAIDAVRPWTHEGETWLRAAHEEAIHLWPKRASARKVASTETLLLALLSASPQRFSPYAVGREDCMSVIRWAHESPESRGGLPAFVG